MHLADEPQSLLVYYTNNASYWNESQTWHAQ